MGAIIGISGKIASGKDLSGQIFQYIGQKGSLSSFSDFEENWLNNIVDIHGCDYQIKKFADALKDNVCTLLGVDRNKLEDRVYKETPLGEEWWYYDLGTQIRPYGFYTGVDKKIADERFLVKPTPRLILQRLGTEGVRNVIHPNAWVNAAMAGHTDQNWIFTDMRFPNELEAVQKKGGITVRLERGDGDTGNHPSETALDDHIRVFDYVIDNNDTMEMLYWKIFGIMEDFKLL